METQCVLQLNSEVAFVVMFTVHVHCLSCCAWDTCVHIYIYIYFYLLSPVSCHTETATDQTGGLPGAEDLRAVTAETATNWNLGVCSARMRLPEPFRIWPKAVFL